MKRYVMVVLEIVMQRKLPIIEKHMNSKLLLLIAQRGVVHLIVSPGIIGYVHVFSPGISQSDFIVT